MGPHNRAPRNQILQPLTNLNNMQTWHHVLEKSEPQNNNINALHGPFRRLLFKSGLTSRPFTEIAATGRPGSRILLGSSETRKWTGPVAYALSTTFRSDTLCRAASDSGKTAGPGFARISRRVRSYRVPRGSRDWRS